MFGLASENRGYIGLEAGRTMAQTDEIISLSGVSRSTLFRFFRGDNIRSDAKQRILSAMQQLNIQYESPRAGESGALIISIRPDFKYFKGYGLSIMGFMSRAEQLGFRVQLQTEGLSSTERLKKVPDLQGVLILGKTLEEEAADIELLRAADLPHVLINRMFDDVRVSWVCIDMVQAARDAVAHLIDLGHRGIGTWGASRHYRIDRDKRRGYELAFEERGMEIPNCRFDDEHDGSIEEVIQRLIDQRALPSAWFAANDEIAMRMAKVVRENGLSIPEDIAVVGMDDVEPAAFMNPPLTSIHIPYQEAGESAMDTLKLLIEKQSTLSQRVLLKHHLVVRESCGTKQGAR